MKCAFYAPQEGVGRSLGVTIIKYSKHKYKHKTIEYMQPRTRMYTRLLGEGKKAAIPRKGTDRLLSLLRKPTCLNTAIPSPSGEQKTCRTITEKNDKKQPQNTPVKVTKLVLSKTVTN